MKACNSDLKTRLYFFDAVTYWASELNKDIVPVASSNEVIAAYNHISSYEQNYFLRNNDGTWNKSLCNVEKNDFIKTILWLRKRVIM